MWAITGDEVASSQPSAVTPTFTYMVLASGSASPAAAWFASCRVSGEAGSGCRLRMAQPPTPASRTAAATPAATNSFFLGNSRPKRATLGSSSPSSSLPPTSPPPTSPSGQASGQATVSKPSSACSASSATSATRFSSASATSTPSGRESDVPPGSNLGHRLPRRAVNDVRHLFSSRPAAPAASTYPETIPLIRPRRKRGRESRAHREG